MDSSTTHHMMGFQRDSPADGKYNALKTQLLWVFQLSDEERAERLLSLNGLGDNKPTELALLGSGDATFLFVQLFLRQLPTSVRTTLASSPLECTKDYCGLAEEADRTLLASCPPVSGCVSKRRDQTQKDDSGLCYYHRHFRTKVKCCTPPCCFGSQVPSSAHPGFFRPPGGGNHLF